MDGGRAGLLMCVFYDINLFSSSVVFLLCSGSGVRRRGVWGFSPLEKFWIFRLKNARFISFETPYPMYFHG